jgi:hypothetical protein
MAQLERANLGLQELPILWTDLPRVARLLNQEETMRMQPIRICEWFA